MAGGRGVNLPEERIGTQRRWGVGNGYGSSQSAGMNRQQAHCGPGYVWGDGGMGGSDCAAAVAPRAVGGSPQCRRGAGGNERRSLPPPRREGGRLAARQPSLSAGGLGSYQCASSRYPPSQTQGAAGVMGCFPSFPTLVRQREAFGGVSSRAAAAAARPLRPGLLVFPLYSRTSSAPGQHLALCGLRIMPPNAVCKRDKKGRPLWAG